MTKDILGYTILFMTNLLKNEDEREPEQAPDPLRSIETFDSIHTSLLKTAEAVVNQPSIDGLKSLEERLLSTVNAATTIYFYDFFKASGQEVVVEAAVRAVMTATEELIALLKKISPQYLSSDTYDDDAQTLIVEQIMSDIDGVTEQQVGQLFNNYTVVVGNLERAVLNSMKVSDFVEKKAKRKRQVRVIANFGLTVVAAYVGAGLALREYDRCE